MGGNHGVKRDLVEVFRQIALHAAHEFFGEVWEFGFVGGKRGVPSFFVGFASGFGVPVCVDFFRDGERWVVPADGFAGQLDFFSAQRLAMGFGGVGAVGAAFADVGFANHQSRLVGAGFGVGDGLADGGGAVAVNRANHVPAAGGEAQSGVVDEPRSNLAVNGDAVVVVQGDQLVQLPRACQGDGFVADAFHHATVAHENVGVVVNDVQVFAVISFVEFFGEQLLSQCKTDRVGDALAEWAGGGFYAWGHAHFRVASGFAVQLAEVFQLGHRQFVAGQVQHGVIQHRRVAVGEDETVAVGPMRVARVVFQVV